MPIDGSDTRGAVRLRAPARKTHAALEEADCALCGEGAHNVVHRDCPDRLLRVPGRFDVVRCRRCGLVRTHPRPTREAISAYYPDSYSFFTVDAADPGPAYRALRAAIRLPYRLRYGRVAPEPPSRGDGNCLLDVGSGSGLFLAEMAALGWEPWTIEPNARLARRTAERLGIPPDRVEIGTAEDADFPDGTFDLVTMSHVLEHLHDPLGALEKVARWLRPGGTLRIWLPNFGSIESRVFGRLWHGLDVPRHLHHFSAQTLTELLARSQFDVVRAIPQWQGNMLTGSVVYAVDELRRRKRPYREPRAAHYALLPIASALLALGEGGCLDVTARRRIDRDGAPAT